MLFFGEPWDAPVCDPDDEASVPQAPTPVGRPCFAYGCGRPIEKGDRGLLIPYSPAEGASRMEPWHRRCFMREVMGPDFDLFK